MKSRLLRRTLVADAAISGMTGLLSAAAANPLGELLGVPVPLLRYAGVSLLPFAVLLVVLATREALPAVAVRIVIAANLLWAIDSILLLFTGWIEPSALGYAFIIAQAAIVALFAEIQHAGLRAATAS
jgi:hypothetical protein